MANRHTKLRDQPPVGVLAPTLQIARSLANELRIQKPTLLSTRSQDFGKMQRLSALLVDESCWPLSLAVQDALLPCLDGPHGIGYVLRVQRYDPATGKEIK